MNITFHSLYPISNSQLRGVIAIFLILTQNQKISWLGCTTFVLEHIIRLKQILHFR